MHAFPGLAWGLVRGSVARSSGGAAGRPIALWGGCRAVRTLGLVLVPRIFRRHGVTLSRGPYALAPLIPGSDATSCGSGVSLAPRPNGSRSLPPAGPGPRVPLPPFPFPLPVFFPGCLGLLHPRGGWGRCAHGSHQNNRPQRARWSFVLGSVRPCRLGQPR